MKFLEKEHPISESNHLRLKYLKSDEELGDYFDTTYNPLKIAK